MSLKKVLAILLAVCLIVPMAACGKNQGPDTDGTTTTVQQADVTDGSGEAEPTGEGETTDATGEQATVTDENGETVTTTTKEGETTTTTKNGGGKTTTTKNGGGKTTTTTKPGRTSTKKEATTTSRPDIAGYIGAEVELKKGTVRADKGVDFGGKTFLHASGQTGAASDFTKEGYEIFKQKYNGTIRMDGVGYTNYTQKIAANQASGKVYDIIFLYTPEYPDLITSDCAEPITDYITTADLWTNGKEGGFSDAVIQAFSWNGEAYAMGGAYMQSLFCVFYNKKIFKDNRMEDPADLIAKGQWTWEKFVEMGQKYIKAHPDKYFMPSLVSLSSAGFVQSYNTNVAEMKNGIVKENTADKQLYKAFDMLQKMHYGANRIADTAGGGNAPYDNFASGQTATFLGSAGNWKRFYESAKGNSVFGGTADNLGMVVAPKGDGSPNYGLVDNQAYVAGKGTSDPRAAICYSMMESVHNTLNAFTPLVPQPQEYRDAVCKALDSGKLKAPNSNFRSSLGELPTRLMVREVCDGKSISTVLTTYKKQIQRILDAACK